MFFRKKDTSPADMSRFIMSGGTLSFADWQTLTEEQKQAADHAHAAVIEMQALHLAFLLESDDNRRMTLAQSFAVYDGGALYRQMMQTQNERVMREMIQSEHMADNATD